MRSPSGGGNRLRDVVNRIIFGERPDPADEPFYRETLVMKERLAEIERRQQALRDRVKAHRGH